MALKDLLVYLDPSEDGRRTADFAASLAAKTGAHLTAAGLGLQYMPPGAFNDMGAYAALAEMTEESIAAAQQAYRAFSAAVPAGVETDLVMIRTFAQGASDRFGELARHFDLSIVGQEGPESRDETSLMVKGALFGSGKPVFIVPFIHTGPARFGRAMVCWDRGIPAARALAGALPLLRHAESVEIVTIGEKGSALDELPGFNIARHVARHGVKATLVNLPSGRDVASALLSHASDSAADYMVMGGYGHSKLTEMVFGGTTRSILSAMTVPVLMAH